MDIITVKKVVRRRKVEVREYGYLDTTIVEKQVLYREVRVFGIAVWRTAVDEEVIPDWFLIQYGAFGDRTGWTSKFAQYI